MRIIKFYGIVLLLTTSLMASAQSTKDIPAIKEFDSEKYLGKWYEVARLDHKFERGLDYVAATYILRDDGKITVLNEGVRQDGSKSSIEGKAYIKRPKDKIGELKVSFFLFFYAPYKIIFLDADYSKAVVTSSSKKYLWILSRKPILDESELKELVEFAKSNGFETDKLIFPKQK